MEIVLDRILVQGVASKGYQLLCGEMSWHSTFVRSVLHSATAHSAHDNTFCCYSAAYHQRDGNWWRTAECIW